MVSFIEEIRKGNIAQPTHHGFKISAWKNAWEQATDKDRKNESVYSAGTILFQLMEEIRIELKQLHLRKPDIDNEKLIMAYFAISNRDRAILSRNPEDLITGKINIFSSMLSNNAFSNELTPDEIANGCVDGIQKAVSLRLKEANDQNGSASSNDPMPVLEFVSKESYLSQLYDAYESYWQAILWKEYSFEEVDKKEKIYAITQNMSAFEIGSLFSQVRKERLSMQAHLFSMEKQIQAFCANDKYLQTNSTDSFVIKSISSANEENKAMNTSWRTQEAYLMDEFPLETLNADHGIGFSITEALNVFRILMLLSKQLTLSYPTNDKYQDIKKLLSFCPKFKRMELIKALVKATDYEFQKISKIMDFILFDSSNNKDLWCHPIVAVKPASYILLTSALITPVVKRVVEHWIITMGVRIDTKGTVFENQILNELNNALKNNKLIANYDPATSKRIKLGSNNEEEIDLLCRIGTTIIVGEAKSVVTTDSPISSYRAFETLKGATQQASRKTEFVKNNLEEISQKLGWNYKKEINYSFVNCVINSNRMYVGMTIDGVPICDEKILIKYFEKSRIPLITNKKMENVAWLELYSDFKSLEKNLSDYLFNPPQVTLSPEYYEHKETKLPYINADSYKILYRRLVSMDFKPEDLIKRTYQFPVKTVDNIDEELKDIHVCF